MTETADFPANKPIALDGAVVVTHDFPPDAGDLAAFVSLLPDEALKHPGANRRNALKNKLDSIAQKIAAGLYFDAISDLRDDLRAKTDAVDGGNPNNDWILDPLVQRHTLYLIDALIRALELEILSL